MKVKIRSLCLFLAALGAEAPAWAQPQPAQSSGYQYQFDDELLNSDVRPPRAARIQVRQQWAGANLIRPRASFVTEALRSVERL